MKFRRRVFSSLLFVLLTAVIWYTGDRYEKERVDQALTAKYAQIAAGVSAEVETLIAEKKNATLAIALALAEGRDLTHIVDDPQAAAATLAEFSLKLRRETDFKNVWIQLLDAAGSSVARSWTQDRGDDLKGIRPDVASVIAAPRVHTSISVGRYDLSFKSMIPLVRDGRLSGILEVITHFNSIAEKLERSGFKPVFLVASRFRPQLTHPFTGLFVGDRYVANKNADPELLRRIEERGFSQFRGIGRNHVIDPVTHAIVIDVPLLDDDEQPMADFLLFKPLRKLDLGAVEETRALIHSIMITAVLVVGFILILNESRGRSQDKPIGGRYSFVFALIFLALTTIYAGTLYWYTEVRIADYLQSHDERIEKEYQIVQSIFRSVAESIFQTRINHRDVLDLVASAYTTAEQKNRARERLYELLRSDYENLKPHGVRQLHFHLRSNESFLRFHRPAKFGDDLTGIRSTVEWCNSRQAPIEGFEEGRIYNGFRYVFPLFLDGASLHKQHLGSVEISFSAYALLSKMVIGNSTRGGFLIKDEVVDTKVFRQEKSNYAIGGVPGFQEETMIRRQLEHGFKGAELDQLQPAQLTAIAQRIETGEPFTIGADNGYELFSFIPLRNPVSGRVVATLLLQQYDPFVRNQTNNLLLLLVTGSVAILLMVLFIYRELSSKRRTQALLDRTQKILDAQDSIVVVSDGTRMVDCNRRLLDFTGFPSAAAFRDRHRCICELFQESERFFHMGKVPAGANWIDEMRALPNKDHMVSMADATGRLHAFAVSLNRSGPEYIISFLDISDTVYEQISLERRASHDKLTGAWNRDFFHHNAQRFVREAETSGLKLGLIMMDIDHFKQVNDRYGHARGDVVLVEVVTLAQQSIRSTDALIRWGGEEFLIVALTDSLGHLVRIAEHIRHRIEQNAFNEIGNITCSFGATLHDASEPMEHGVQRADQALYLAKRGGRNRVIRLTNSMPDGAVADLGSGA